MLLNPREDVLYIFAGQRSKEYLSDFYVYDIGASSGRAVFWEAYGGRRWRSRGACARARKLFLAQTKTRWWRCARTRAKTAARTLVLRSVRPSTSTATRFTCCPVWSAKK